MKIVNIGNGKIAIDAPYNPYFISRIKKAQGKWDAGSRKWICDERSAETVRMIMREVYGRDDTPAEIVNVKVSLEKALWSSRGPVVLFGRVIASAQGRDSGARIGDGICFESGGATSGGSFKNWDTIIKDGSVFYIYDVPRAAVEKEIEWDDEYGTYEIIPGKTDSIEALKARREAILEQLAEVDTLLAQAQAQN